MKSLTDITTAIENVRKFQATATTAAAALENELQKVNASRFDADYKQEQTRMLRAKFTPPISEALQAVTTISRELSTSKAAWSSKQNVLARRSLTAPAGDLNTAKDAGLEAVSRLAILTELKLMPDTMLHALADTAKADPYKQGLLHLITLENNSRAGVSPVYEPISLDDVDLPDQQNALSAITEAEGVRYVLENTAKAALGGRVNPIDRLAAGRAAQGVLK